MLLLIVQFATGLLYPLELNRRYLYALNQGAALGGAPPSKSTALRHAENTLPIVLEAQSKRAREGVEFAESGNSPGCVKHHIPTI